MFKKQVYVARLKNMALREANNEMQRRRSAFRTPVRIRTGFKKKLHRFVAFAFELDIEIRNIRIKYPALCATEKDLANLVIFRKQELPKFVGSPTTGMILVAHLSPHSRYIVQ